MESIKKKAKRITSIILIITILVGVLPNFGLLKESKATSEESNSEAKIIIKPDSNEFSSVTNGDRMFKLNIYLNNVTTSIFSLHISYPTDKLDPAELSKVNIPGYGEITSLTESTNFKKVAEFSNLINNPYDLSLINNNMLIINAMEEYSNDFNASGEVLVCSICFKVKDSVENFSDLSYKDFKIDIDNSFINIEGEELSNRGIYSIEEFADSSLPKVQSISVKTNPTEGNKYAHGDTIDLEGGELTVTYTDGSTKDISMKDEGVIIKTGEQIGATADINNKSLTFEYEEASTELEVNVIDPVESIEFYDKNNIIGTLTFYNGDILEETMDFDNIYVKAIRKSKTEEEIPLSDSRISLDSEKADIKKVRDPKINPTSGDPSGIQEIEITYRDEDSEATTSFNIIVNDKIGDIKISKTNAPETTLIVGSQFTKTGAIEIIGESGISYGEIPMSSGDVTVTEIDGSKVDLSKPTKEGEKKTLKVTYGNASKTYEVEVKDFVNGIRVNQDKTTFTKYNESLKASDFTGITVTEIMASGVEGATVALNFAWIDTSEYDNTTTKEQNLKVNYPYNDKVIEGKVSVQVEDKLLGIRVENLKDEYIYKDELDYEGAELYTQYVSGEIGVNLLDFDLSDPDSDLKLTGFDSTIIGDQELTFTYNDGVDEASTKVTVNVGKATLEAPECEQLTIVEGLAISTIEDQLPTTEYGSVIWKDGAQKLTYVEGSDNIQEVNAIYKMNDTYSPYYKDVEFTVKVQVEKRDVSSIAITKAPDKVEYVEGQDFDPTGMVITVTYNDGGTAEIKEEYKGVTFAPLASLQTTDEKITVTYSGKTAEQAITVVAKKVTSIAVTTAPTKASYVEGQSLDLTGMIVTATYNDETSATTTEYTTTPADRATLNTVGTQEIEVTYTGADAVAGIETTKTSVEVVAKKVTSITVTKAPTKANYIEGQALDLAGMIVTATYNDETSATTTEYTTTPADRATLNTVGTQTIEVTYTGEDAVAGIETASTTVEVVEKQLTGIKITKEPTKTDYIEGQTFKKAGMVVKAVYDNEDEEEITDYTITDETRKLTTSDTKMIINYKGQTAEQAITVVEKQLTGIKITKAPTKTDYIEGQTFKKAGMVVKAVYDNEDEEEITDYTIVDETRKLTTSDTKMVINYKGQTAEQEITVAQKQLVEIKITKEPTKTDYIEGQTFKKAGMVVIAIYDNEDEEEVTNYTIVNETRKLTTTDTKMIINYNGQTAEQEITVAKKVVTSIEVTTPPTKTSYVEGHPFESAGMVVTAYYNDGTDAPTTHYTISPSGDLTPANTKITVTYTGTDIAEDASAPTADITITVSERQVESIEITKAPTKVNYIEGQDFDPTGMEITVTYNDHEKPLVISSDYATKGVIFAPSTSLQTTNTEVVVSYRGFTDNQEITVIPDYVTDITITAPSKLDYKYGDAIDLTNATVTKVWASGLTHTNDTIPMTKDMLQNSDITSFDNMNSLGQKQITVTYDTVVKANAFTITISDYINSIEIEDKTKLQTEYEYGDTINITDKDTGAKLYIFVKYAGGTPEKKVELTTDMLVGSTHSMNKVQDNQIVTVTYLEKTDTFKINVKDKVIGIDIIKEPAKKVYKLNDPVSFSGINVRNVMASGETGNLLQDSEYQISTVNTTTTGEKTVTVTKIGTTFTDTFKIKVIDATEGMNITTLPKQDYNYGQGLDITAGEITITSQTDTIVLPMTDAKVTVTGYNPNKLGDQTLTVTYTYTEETDNGMETKVLTDTYTVTVKDYAIGIVITKTPDKLTYEYGEELELAGGKVAEKTASGATRNEVAITGEMVSGYSKTTEGIKTLTVTYLGKTATFNVTVKDLTKGISMNTLPNKTEYTQGQAIDVAGAVLNVTKSSGIKEIAITKEMISGYDPNKVGTQVITVTYDGFTTEFVVVVKAKTVEKPTTPVKPNKPTNPVTPSTPSTSEVIKYTVTFINYDGSVIKTEEVESGKSATAPELEERKGYRFLGWDTEFEVVEEDLTVMVQYEKIEATTKPSEKPSEVLGVKDEVNSTENDITSTLIPALAGVTVSGLLLLLIAAITKKNVEIYAVSEGERKLLGKEKLTKNCRTVSIDKYKEELGKGSLEVVLNSKISSKLNGENVDIILGEKELTYKVKVNENEAFVIEIKNK